MSKKVLRYFEQESFRTGEVSVTIGKCVCQREVLVAEKEYKMMRTCDESEKPILVFDNSDGEYIAIRICLPCMRLLIYDMIEAGDE